MRNYERHGGKGTRLYQTWKGMRARIHKESNPGYKNYGGRGIKICDEWNKSFIAFRKWALSHGYADNLTIERINVNGDYCPENCTWIEKSDQSANMRTTIYITAWNERKALRNWLKDPRCKVSHATLFYRIKQGFNPEEAISTPAEQRKEKPEDGLYEAFGEKKRIVDWVEDPRCSVSYRTLLGRIFIGWDIERSILERKVDQKKEFSKKLVAWNEEKTLNEWIEDHRCNNKNKAEIMRRIKKGWTPERSISTPIRKIN